MFQRLVLTATTLLCLGLAGCGGTMPASSSSSSGSGIEVFGEIDAGISRTR